MRASAADSPRDTRVLRPHDQRQDRAEEERRLGADEAAPVLAGEREGGPRLLAPSLGQVHGRQPEEASMQYAFKYLLSGAGHLELHGHGVSPGIGDGRDPMQPGNFS